MSRTARRVAELRKEEPEVLSVAVMCNKVVLNCMKNPVWLIKEFPEAYTEKVKTMIEETKK